MSIVYVEHFILETKQEELIQNWYREVYDLMSQQEGFLSLSYETQKGSSDSVHFKLSFSTPETMDKWLNHPRHDALVEALNPFRSRPYFFAGRSDEGASLEETQMERYEAA